MEPRELIRFAFETGHSKGCMSPKFPVPRHLPQWAGHITVLKFLSGHGGLTVSWLPEHAPPSTPMEAGHLGHLGGAQAQLQKHWDRVSGVLFFPLSPVCVQRQSCISCWHALNTSKYRLVCPHPCFQSPQEYGTSDLGLSPHLSFPEAPSLGELVPKPETWKSSLNAAPPPATPSYLTHPAHPAFLELAAVVPSSSQQHQVSPGP